MQRFGFLVDRKQHYETKNTVNFGNARVSPIPSCVNTTRANQFYDDETFVNISLNLLVRYEALDLTAGEAIKAILISLEEQKAFNEALCARIAKISHGGECSAPAIVQKIYDVFGNDLRGMCSPQHLTALQIPGPGIVEAPMTPRNNRNPACFHRILNPRKFMKDQRCNFFPESDPKSSRRLMKAKVRNIDWHLASTVQQVVSLSLDAPEPPEKRDFICYEPPSPIHCHTA